MSQPTSSRPTRVSAAKAREWLDLMIADDSDQENIVDSDFDNEGEDSDSSACSNFSDIGASEVANRGAPPTPGPSHTSKRPRL
jgi:hypothetical protein